MTLGSQPGTIQAPSHITLGRNLETVCRGRKEDARALSLRALTASCLFLHPSSFFSTHKLFVFTWPCHTTASRNSLAEEAEKALDQREEKDFEKGSKKMPKRSGSPGVLFIDEREQLKARIKINLLKQPQITIHKQDLNKGVHIKHAHDQQT